MGEGPARAGSPHGLRSRTLAAVLLAFLTLVLPCARAADTPAVEITSIDWGLDGSMAAERWSPVTLYLQSRQRPFSGVLTVEFGQDATQQAAISLPVATTPGLATPVELCLALPATTESVAFTFLGDRARERYVFTQKSNASSAGLLPSIVGGTRWVILVESLSARAAFFESDPNDATVIPALKAATPEAAPGTTPAPTDDEGVSAPEDEPEIVIKAEAPVTVAPAPPTPPAPPVPGAAANRSRAPAVFPWDAYLGPVLSPQRLPRSWMAYDAVDAVVIRGEAGVGSTALDPRAVEALRTWVASGGRLIILAHEAGDGWLRWFPEWAGPLPVAVGERQNVEARDAVPGHEASIGRVMGRPLRVTPAGERAGWTTRWRQDDGSVLLAEGPAAFGWITILGVDPAEMVVDFKFTARRDAWRSVLRPVLEPRAARVDSEDRRRFAPWMGANAWFGSAPDLESSVAQRRVMDHLVQVPPFADSAFWVIAACVLALALLLGPVDFFVLKRLGLRHRSWLTALGWVLIASAIAFVVPSRLRSAESLVQRMVVRDVVLAADGAPSSVECQTALTTVFAGKVARPKFPPPGEATWFRGISPLPMYQRLGGQSALAAYQGTAPDSDQRGNFPISTSLNQWTLRGYLDHTPAALAMRGGDAGKRAGDGAPSPVPRGDSISARAGRNADGWTVEVVGLPADAAIRHAHLRAFNGGTERWWALEGDRANPRLLRCGRETVPVPAQWQPIQPTEGNPYAYYGDGPSAFTPAAALQMPGARDRTAALEARVKHGRCVALYAHVEGLTPTLELRDFTAREQAVLRILIPIEPDEPGALAPTSEPSP